VKRVITALLLLTALTAVAEAQFIMTPNRPYLMLSPRPGYVTINEFTAGFGLGGTTTPFSKYFYGATTVHGYQINNGFSVGGGTGIMLYEDGPLIPLFADFRFNFIVSTYSFYVFGNSGLLIDPSNLNSGSKLYASGGPGVRIALSRKFAINFSPGILTQMGPTSRASFVNFKLGFTLKPD
jgi:hypothetical protein